MVGDKETSMLSAIVYLSVGLTRTVIRNAQVARRLIGNRIRLEKDFKEAVHFELIAAALLLKHSLATLVLDFFGSLNGNYA